MKREANVTLTLKKLRLDKAIIRTLTAHDLMKAVAGVAECVTTDTTHSVPSKEGGGTTGC